jgi:hypothetical protein
VLVELEDDARSKLVGNLEKVIFPIHDGNQRAVAHCKFRSIQGLGCGESGAFRAWIWGHGHHMDVVGFAVMCRK